MKTTLAILAVLAIGASAAPTNGTTHEFEARSQMRSKRGGAFNNVAQVAPMAGTIGWAYNWNHVKDGNLPKGVEYVPMLWGTDANHLNGWNDAANAAIKAGAKHLLGFNEPDNAGQAHMTPQAAAAAWKKYMQPFAGKAKLVSPAITNAGPPNGEAWMDSFLKECKGCTIDAIAIHIYDRDVRPQAVPSNEAYFKTYIPAAGKKYGKPIWVTEFAGDNGAGDEAKFIKDMVPFLDQQASVERYAYFGLVQGRLVNNNQLTTIGNAYKNA